jgi:hypothetical protein
VCCCPFFLLRRNFHGTFGALVRISLQGEIMRALRFAAMGFWIAVGAVGATLPEKLTVVIFDYAHISPRLVLSAASEGRRAFRTAGVESDWILCNPVEGCYVPERFVQVKILPKPIASTPVSLRGLGATTTCTATEHCSASYVFYNRVLAFADDASSPTDLALGYVMVHEIGHLMGLGHSPRGIMTAAFTSRDLRNAAAGWLCFEGDDARELRAAVERSQKASDTAHHIKLAGWHGEAAE